MDKKKMIALPLIAIMLSLTTAVAVAHWVDYLYVDGMVETGYLCACFSVARNLYDGPDWTCDPGFKNIREIVPIKDYADTNVKIVDCDTAEVRITNGYPCFYDHVIFGVENCGTVPWAILSVTFATPYENVTITRNAYLTLDLSGDGQDDIEIRWGDNFGLQIDPEQFADLSWEFHLKNPIPQNGTFTFSITIEVINWNEHPSFRPTPP